jgi:hypothetical protein
MHLLAQYRNSRRIDETAIEAGACHLRNLSVGIQEPREARHVRRASRPSAIEQKSSAACRIPAVARQGAIRVKQSPTFGATSARQTCLLLQLPSGLPEEPGGTSCEGFVPHVVRFGSVAEASIFPKSDPIAHIHFVFRIDQIL